MGLSDPTRTTGETGYLCADKYTSTLVGTRALATAFELGLVDLLLDERTVGPEALAKSLGIDRPGMDLLLGALLSSDVIGEDRGNISLTEGFIKALNYRDLIEVRASFANLCALDLIEHFSSLVNDPQQFLQNANLFKLFDYSHAFVSGPENLDKTKSWINITTTLTKYEAEVVMDNHDFSRYGRVLDIGGNSGEFVLRLCKVFPELVATVFDLPVVCEVGRQHVAGEPEAGRIDFIGGNALSDHVPGGFDVVTLKSILHDWPEDVARQFIRRAVDSVAPGGTVLIFERGPLDMKGADIPYHLIPYLLFARFFRTPELYADELTRIGFEEVKVRRIELDMPFFMVTGTKPRH